MLPDMESLETGLEDVVRMERLGFLIFREHEESKTPSYLPTTRKDMGTLLKYWYFLISFYE